jgi:hypothetical protein
MRYVDGGGGGKELVLTWKGKNLPLVREGEEAEGGEGGERGVVE